MKPSRLCQVRLHHVITSPPEGLGPARQVLTSCFSGTCFCENRRLVLSCHGFRIGREYPDRPKRGLHILVWGLYKTHPRVLKWDTYFESSGAPKMTPWSNFHMPVISHGMIFMIHKPARVFSRGRLLNLFFGSSQTDHWLSKYGHFKFGGTGVFPILVYL